MKYKTNSPEHQSVRTIVKALGLRLGVDSNGYDNAVKTYMEWDYAETPEEISEHLESSIQHLLRIKASFFRGMKAQEKKRGNVKKATS